MNSNEWDDGDDGGDGNNDNDNEHVMQDGWTFGTFRSFLKLVDKWVPLANLHDDRFFGKIKNFLR